MADQDYEKERGKMVEAFLARKPKKKKKKKY